MGRFRSGGWLVTLSILSLWSVSGCGGGKKAGPPIFAGKITINPSNTASLVLGGTFTFTASAQSTSGTNLSTTFTFASSDTSVLNIAPNGVACAGHWDANFTTCTPGGTGAAQVTASALGGSSAPVFVFVHPPIDNIIVKGVTPNGTPVQEPCLSQSQTMTVEAHAYSQGVDVTSSVGPFTFSANNPAVVALTPLVNTAYNFATNQATAKAAVPGITQIYASATGVSSTSFQQPQFTNSQGVGSPVLDFFATCPIQRISLEVSRAGSTQTTFVAPKGSQTFVATLTDVMGNSSLPNTNNGIVLSKIPLNWTASQPQVIPPGNGCTQSCVVTTISPGAGSVTASCSPPTCNIGFPEIPASLSTPALLAACTDFFHAQFPQFISCQQVIPVPVYASAVPDNTLIPPFSNGSISGVITGTTSSATVLATSTGCAQQPPAVCTTSVYGMSTAKASTGPENPMPVSPNSLLFDLAGDKAYMGSAFGAQVVNPANLGTANSAFTGLGTVTGKILAVSPNGSVGVFSDTVHTPNQVYIVNGGNTNAVSASALNIPAATAAAFSPDGLKAFIVGNSGSSLYVFSSLQALQGPIALTGAANNVKFSPNGGFAFIAAATANGSPASLSAFATCNNQIAAPAVTLPADPILMRVLPGQHIDGRDSYGNPIPDGTHVFVLDATGFDIITSTISDPQPGTLCPQTLTFVSGDPLRMAQRVELGQGTIQPVNFFASVDGAKLYVLVAGNASILVYDFGAGSVTSGIELLGNATPISADISVDAGTIAVAGSDGMLHEISTALGGSDQVQLDFPNLPNGLNAFCTDLSSRCTFDLVAIKP